MMSASVLRAGSRRLASASVGWLMLDVTPCGRRGFSERSSFPRSERAARERLERVGKALAAVEQLAAQRERRKKGDGSGARASSTGLAYRPSASGGDTVRAADRVRR